MAHKQSPTKDVSRPKENPPRDRRPTREETDRLIHVSGYGSSEPPRTVSARVVTAYLFAIETGMRAGEIAGIRKEHVYECYVHVAKSKNGHARDVQLSSEAQRIIKHIMNVTQKQDHVFGMKASSIDAIFRKLKKQAGVIELRFHDTRREALTRLSKKLTVMELAKVSGHRDLRVLQNVYFSPTVDDLADKLD